MDKNLGDFFVVGSRYFAYFIKWTGEGYKLTFNRAEATTFANFDIAKFVLAMAIEEFDEHLEVIKIDCID